MQRGRGEGGQTYRLHCPHPKVIVVLLGQLLTAQLVHLGHLAGQVLAGLKPFRVQNDLCYQGYVDWRGKREPSWRTGYHGCQLDGMNDKGGSLKWAWALGWVLKNILDTNGPRSCTGKKRTHHSLGPSWRRV